MLLRYLLKDLDIYASSYHYYNCNHYLRQDNSVSIMNRLRPGGSQYQGFFVGGGKDKLPFPQRPDGGPHPIKLVREALSPGTRRPKSEAHATPVPAAEVNACTYTFNPPTGFHEAMFNYAKTQH
jgi:hypothetical protein